MAAENQLYYGDNLDVLRQHIQTESVDLIYLDPPFNSDQDHNVLFRERDGSRAAAQIQAFEDTWEWDESAEEAYREVTRSSDRLAVAVLSLRGFLGTSDMMAYLCMMAPRLKELRRVLKPTGTLFLHCDSAASHYLKIVLDAVFGHENFRNEIVWQRTLAKSLMTRQLPRNHDAIFVYQKTSEAFWDADALFQPYDPSNLDKRTASKYSHRDAKGRVYRLDNLLNPNRNRPNLKYEFLGVTRVWRWTKARMQEAYDRGLVVQTKPGAVPQFKRYLDLQRGRPVGDVWTDIPPLNSQAKERLGYPTQKPEALLERIIRAGSPASGLVLDPFCGCGTTVAAAEKLNRRWIGIDITHLAINLIRHRLIQTYGPDITASFRVTGEPVDLHGAAALAEEDKFQFQCWALGLVGARPAEPKRGADKGIDGRFIFQDSPHSDESHWAVFSVKGGKLKATDVRDLRGVLEREHAAIAALISLEEPTKAMRTEAATAGVYTSRWTGQSYPRLQLLTVADLLAGQRLRYPGEGQISPKVRSAERAQQLIEQPSLFEGTKKMARVGEDVRPRRHKKGA